MAWEPDQVAAGVHVQAYGLGLAKAEGEGEDVVAARGEWDGELPAAAEAGCRAGGGGADKVGDGEVCFGVGVGER